MLKLQFELEYQKINLVNRWETVATDSKNYLVASFSTISDDWTTPITAIFTNDKDEQPYAVVVGADSTLESNECYVPWEVLKDESNVYVSAYCGNLHTTVTAQFHVYKSGYADGETPPPPSPTVYDAIMEAITALQTGKQDKLIAGENITIDEDNVISAEGGVTSYDDLTDKPSINNVTLSGNKTLDDLSLQGKLTAGTNISIINNEISANINRNYFLSQQYAKVSYDFNSFSGAEQYQTGMWRIKGTATVQNFPQALEDIRGRAFYVFNYPFIPTGAIYSIRKVVGTTENGDFKEYAQIYTALDNGNIISQSDWVELTGGGSQIVSGVVNANGTITFTDSDGNTFTTTGSSVIGADGFSPVATVTQTSSGATVSITDKNGTTTANISNGQDGNDYVLTAQDKSDIADIVLSELPTTQGVQYGN